MDRNTLEQTQWAKDFKESAPVSYPEGIKLALQPNLEVTLNHTDENGEWQWLITVVESNGFLMDAFDQRQQAVDLCKEMGWVIVSEHDEQTGITTNKDELVEYAFRDGQTVNFDNHSLKGKGIIRGAATIPAAVIGRSYIIEVLESSEPLPNATYPFKFITMFEVNITAVVPRLDA